MTIPIARLDPRKTGLARWLPPLEAQVMARLWASDGGMTAQEVLAALNAERARPYAYTTIMTTLSRLHKRGLLSRGQAAMRKGVGYRYAPVCSLRDYVRAQTRYALVALEEQTS